MCPRTPRLPICCLMIAGIALATPAKAQPTNNDYAVDLFQGPILAPTRVTAMGGAYAGYAEGIGGFVANAASPALREPWSSSWFDQDIDASISVPLGLFDNNDFDNSGDLDADYSNFLYLSAGGLLQLGPFGAGFFGDLQRFALTFEPDKEETVITVGRYHVLLGWHFFEGQLNTGVGVRALTLGISSSEAELTTVGAAPQVGILVRPDWTPFRFGATYRHPVRSTTSVGSGASTDAFGVERAGRLVLPDRVELPWEVELGIALQVGPRPLNPAWINPHDHEQELRDAHNERERRRERTLERKLEALAEGGARARLRALLLAREAATKQREAKRLERDLGRLKDERRARARNWPREALLLNLDLLVTGPVDNAISLERFLGQGQAPPAGTQCRVVASGEEVNFSPRLGMEMEPVPQWVHTRFGTYYEPPRYRYEPTQCNDRVGRQHFTFGADIKLLSTTWWGLVPEVTYKLQGYGDFAPRYQALGLGLGVWH
jgi:hypothetical protein